MSITVMKKKFDVPPNKDEILGLVTGNKGDKGKAKDALLSILSPMKDLLALLEYVETMDTTAKQYADLLKEQEGVQTSIASLKAVTVTAQKAFAAAKQKADDMAEAVALLEQKRDAVAAEVVSAEQAKLRVNKAVSDEYDRLRDEMLKEVEGDEELARKELGKIQGAIAAAKTELETLQAKKRAFIASLTG